jgi:hypothetical protein
LRGHHLSSVSKLIKNDKGLALHLDDATNRRRIKLHQIVKLELAQGSCSTNVAGFAKILAKNSDFSVGLVRQESHTIL